MKERIDQYAVMGYPIEHSKSPLIHSAFALQTKQSINYQALLVEPGNFKQAVHQFFAGGGQGLNITLPFKREAWELAEKHSEDALLAGAVNTLLMDENGRLTGHNTDGMGLVRDITENYQGSLTGKSILILGAGGASRGILRPFLRENPTHICIANRTVSKAVQLQKEFSAYGNINACGFEGLNGQQFDWLINASSASLQGEIPPLPTGILSAGSWCYDLMYGQTETAFCQWARKSGAQRSLDGLGMLVEQAAESFYLWRGIRPETEAVMTQLRK